MVEKTYAMLDNGVRGPDLLPQHHVPPNSLPIDYSTDLQMNCPSLKTEEKSSFCSGCGQRIVDRYYLLAVDKPWHLCCLKCSDCHLLLDSEQTCFAKDGYIFCKDDYYRRFSVKRCSRCNVGISSQELVMRARHLVFHLSCFTCTSCNQPLAPGDYYGLFDNLVYCQHHYELLLHEDFIHSVQPGLVTSPPGHGPFFNSIGSIQKGRPKKRKSPGLELEHCTQSNGIGSDDESNRHPDVMERDLYPGGHSRQKRVRTSFKHHQLRTMKSYFSLNHNPDAKDLKQLAQKTGLPKRVLQVWFQNARAKYRRNLLKQEGCENISDDKTIDDGQKEDSLEQPENSCSPCMTDLSSSPSYSDIQNGSAIDSDQGTRSLPDLFSSSITSIN